MASIDVVIVNWNSRHYLRQCVASLYKTWGSDPALVRSVYVIDNASTDDSLDGIEMYGLPLYVVRNDSNAGFAAACNQGAWMGDAELLLFLNPDATVSAEALRAAADFMARPDQQSVGICSVQLVDDDGEVARSCSRFPSAGMFLVAACGLDRLFPGHFRRNRMAEWDHMESREVDQVIGAFFLIRRSLFEQLGGFDERYFVYFEEVDLSYRARQHGYSSMFLADARAYHRGGVSSESVKAKRLFYSLRSRMLYAFKHFGFAQALLVAFVTLCVEPASRLLQALLKRSAKGALETLKGYGYLWAWLPRYLLFRKTR